MNESVVQAQEKSRRSFRCESCWEAETMMVSLDTKAFLVSAPRQGQSLLAPRPHVLVLGVLKQAPF